MRLRIIAGGIFGADGELPVGFEFDTVSEIPAGWAGKVIVIEDEPKPGSVPLTNDAPTREDIAEMDKAEVLEWLDAHGWDGDKRLGVEKLRDALTAIMFVAD